MRLDAEMMNRSLVRSRSEAQTLIASGAVTVDGESASKPAQKVYSSTTISIADVPRWASRGAVKLQAGLDAFAIGVDGRSAIDVGSSTGGFTEILLVRGASHVLAIDVGHGQMTEHLRADSRVTLLENTDVRDVKPADLPGGPADVVVVDVSFISLTKLVDTLRWITRPGGDVVALVKPQYEVGPAAVGKRGVVKRSEDRAAALNAVKDAFTGAGFRISGITNSPVRGGSGNIEFLLWASPGEEMESTG